MDRKAAIPIALIDDHNLMREALAKLIDGLGGYHVVLQAGHGKEFIAALDGGPQVDIAIVDLNMPVMDGYQTIAWIRHNRPEIRPLALTFDGRDDAVIKAVRNGARGFMLKDIEPKELKRALDTIVATGYYHSELTHERSATHADGLTDHERLRAQVLERVTGRELEFLAQVCDPKEPTYEEIAVRMKVHRRTIDGFREALFNRFGIKSKVGLVIFAVKWGIVKV